MITLTLEESLNLIDALEEWKDVVTPKELKENEIGLNDERYEKIMKKLINGGKQ
jgi:hypothetical protein